MAFPAWLTQALGLLGAACFAAMLVPQARLNWWNQSTQGMSLGLIILWHWASVLCTAYYSLDLRDNLFPMLSMISTCVVCATIEAQAATYRPSVTSAKGCRLLSLALAICLASAAVIGACIGVFRVMPANVTYLLGNMIPSVLLGLGFLPQMHEFVSSMSIKGYSFGVTAFDLVGSSANAAVLFAPANVQFTEALKEAAPFLTIIGMHLVLITIAVAIVCWGRSKRHCDAKSCQTDSEVAAEISDDSTSEGSEPESKISDSTV